MLKISLKSFLDGPTDEVLKGVLEVGDGDLEELRRSGVIALAQPGTQLICHGMLLRKLAPGAEGAHAVPGLLIYDEICISHVYSVLESFEDNAV